VDGIAMSVIIAESWGTAASKWYHVPVPEYKDWTALAKNWLISYGYGWNWAGYSSDTTEVKPRPAGEPEPEQEPEEDPTLASGDPSNPDSACPIIIDTGRNGYKLTDVREGVQFDLDADGIPEQVSWTHQDSDEAFLAMDRNGNGRIDDGSELFGNNTPVYPGLRLTTSNGFDALGFLESPDYGRSNADEIVGAHDEMFGRLLLWIDRNHNGVSEPDELRSAASAGVVGIAAMYREKVQKRDRHGNLFRQRGTIYWTDGEDKCYDVWLQMER